MRGRGFIRVEETKGERRRCPNDGAALLQSSDAKLAGCLECPKCGFVQGFGVIAVSAPKPGAEN